ncbi:MAG: ATP-binding protein [Spirochaetaceae bacterium]|jgi:AAA+ ATPase superfamily predicted ATPase|nr:ATP-binding protein [Spirochaetaceae bacterium]
MNPFVYNQIAEGSRFYDRKEETQEIIRWLENGTNLVLYGPRHYGKTSLVYKVINYFEEKDYICIYFNFMNVYSLENFISLYSKALARKQQPLQRFAKFLQNGVKSIRPVLSIDPNTGAEELSIDFDNSHISVLTLDDMLDLTEKLAGKDNRVFVFFDEFQEAAKIPNINFEGMLRSKIQFQDRERIRYLFFGSKTHLMQQAFMNNRRPFYQSARPVVLGLPPENETVEYLLKVFSKEDISISKECAEYIMQKAGNIPYYVQMLGSEIWQYMMPEQKTVTKEIINASVKIAVSHNSDTYEEIIYNVSEKAKDMLLLMANDKKTSLPDEERKEIELELRDKGITEFTDMQYYIADPFFRLYIKEIINGNGLI